MTKPFRKNRPPQKQKIPASDKQKNVKKIVALAAILILAAIPFGLGKSGFFCQKRFTKICTDSS